MSILSRLRNLKLDNILSGVCYVYCGFFRENFYFPPQEAMQMLLEMNWHVTGNLYMILFFPSVDSFANKLVLLTNLNLTATLWGTVAGT